MIVIIGPEFPEPVITMKQNHRSRSPDKAWVVLVYSL
jgi:hypothetical protein